MEIENNDVALKKCMGTHLNVNVIPCKEFQPFHYQKNQFLTYNNKKK